MSRKCGDWIEYYLDYTKHSEAPEKFHFWTAVSTIAGALRRRVWLDMGYFTWTPNFYIFFVAPPGIVNKSTTGSLGMDLLRELGYINFGPSAGTWQALINRMTEMMEEFEMPDESFMPMTAVTGVISELGTFIDPRNREQIDVLVDLWDGKQGAWKKSTKYDGDEIIVNPWVNLLGFTTPSWVAENFSDYFSGGGFMSRSIFVYAEKKRHLVAYPSRHLPDDFHEQRNNLIHDLDKIATLVGGCTMTEDAYAWGEKWYKEHYAADHEHLSNDKFAGYLARKQTQIHKLAMVLSASRRDDLVITEDELSDACDYVTQLEAEMPKMFGKVGQEKVVKQAAEVFSFIKSSGKNLTQTLIYRNFSDTISYTTFEEIVRSLVHSGYIKQVQKDNVINLVPITKEKKNG